MDITPFFLTIKSNALRANGGGEATTSNTPAFVVNAGILILKPLSMDARLVSGTGIIHILVTPTTLTDHSNVDGIL